MKNNVVVGGSATDNFELYSINFTAGETSVQFDLRNKESSELYIPEILLPYGLILDHRNKTNIIISKSLICIMDVVHTCVYIHTYVCMYVCTYTLIIATDKRINIL